MKIIFISLSIITMTFFGSCIRKEKADLVIINGKVLTIDKDNPAAEAGAMLAFGTDYQVEPLNPMEGLYAAVTRKERLGEDGEG